MAKITEGLTKSIKSAVKGGISAAKVASTGDQVTPLLKILGKNFMTLPGIARDINVARQNAQKLVKLEGGEPARGADAHWLKEGERETKLEVEMAKEKEEKKPSAISKAPGVSKIKSLIEQFKESNFIKKFQAYFKIAAVAGIILYQLKDAFAEWVSNIWEDIKLKFDEFVLNIKQWFLDSVQPIIDQVSDFIEDWIILPVKNFFGKFAEYVKGYFQFWYNLITSPIETVKKVWDGFMSIVNTAKEKFQEWKDSIVKWYADAPSWAKALVPKFLEEKMGLVETPEQKAARDGREKGRQEQDSKKASEESAKKKKAEEDEKARVEKRASARAAERAAEQKKLDDERKKLEERRKAKPKAEAKPTAATAAGAEPPKVPPPSEPSAAPRPAATATKPSDAKPVKVASESGKKAMIKAMDDYKVTDPTARASIMAQVGHESGGFKVLSENLNYRPQTLLKIFPKYFKTPGEAEQTAAAGPEAIANRVYGGRMGNAPDEGFKYRGRGFVQLTGKDNYKKFGYASNPDDVATPEAGADTAMKYMMQYKGDWGDIKKVTKFVNGGYIGLEDRAKHFQEYLNDPTITQVAAVSTATSGGSVSSASTDLASGQRQQAKPQTPIVVNAPTTNTTVVTQKKTQVVAAQQDSAKLGAARAV